MHKRCPKKNEKKNKLINVESSYIYVVVVVIDVVVDNDEDAVAVVIVKSVQYQYECMSSGKYMCVPQSRHVLYICIVLGINCYTRLVVDSNCISYTNTIYN